MLPFGAGDGGGQIWNPDAVAEENSDWVPTTTASLFSSPFYLTNQQGDLLGNQPHVDSSVAGAPLRPANSAADNSSWLFGNFNNDIDASQWQLPQASAPTAHHALASPSSTVPTANWSGPSDTGELLGSSSHLPGGGLGDTQENKVDRRDFAPEHIALSRPVSSGTRNPSSDASSAPRARLTASVTPVQAASTAHKSQSKPNEGKANSPTRKRVRESVSKSPATKKKITRTSIQPNEEEQARRIHMAAYTRGSSLVSSPSSQSRGAPEVLPARREDDLRVAESSLLENMGAGKAPGVLRTPNQAESVNQEFSLPLGKGFPIQIGSELFRLSGASIMSDCQSNAS